MDVTAHYKPNKESKSSQKLKTACTHTTATSTKQKQAHPWLLRSEIKLDVSQNVKESGSKAWLRCMPILTDLLVHRLQNAMGYDCHRRTTRSASVAVCLQDRESGRRFLPAHVGSVGRHCSFHCGEGHLYVCGGMDLAVLLVFVECLYVCGGMNFAVLFVFVEWLYVCGGMDPAVLFIFVECLYVCGGMNPAVLFVFVE